MVLVETSGNGITHVVLNRPDRLNALDAESVEQLHAALSTIARDPACRVVVLRGAGPHFCAGADLAGHGVAPGGDGSRSPQDWMATQQHIADLVPRLRAMPQPVIAAVHGAAAGGGFALALACDLRICAADARFNAAFVRVGLSGCDIGVSWLLPRLIGAARAFEVLLTGRFVDAVEAERIGLVSRVTPGAELIAHADALAAAITANSPYGVRMTKKVMWAQLETASLLAGLALEDATQVSAAMSADHAEAVAAFTEHRAPVFRDG
ncbi:MAG TPA: enoyl-CoA hydratase-related protein [Jatrophihabitantaceae bacterium]|jgi:enoyl-CoA hydratase